MNSELKQNIFFQYNVLRFFSVNELGHKNLVLCWPAYSLKPVISTA